MNSMTFDVGQARSTYKLCRTQRPVILPVTAFYGAQECVHMARGDPGCWPCRNLSSGRA